MSVLPYCETLGLEAGATHTQPTHALTQSTEAHAHTINVDGKVGKAHSEDSYLHGNSLGDRQTQETQRSEMDHSHRLRAWKYNARP